MARISGGSKEAAEIGELDAFFTDTEYASAAGKNLAENLHSAFWKYPVIPPLFSGLPVLIQGHTSLILLYRG